MHALTHPPTHIFTHHRGKLIINKNNYLQYRILPEAEKFDRRRVETRVEVEAV